MLSTATVDPYLEEQPQCSVGRCIWFTIAGTIFTTGAILIVAAFVLPQLFGLESVLTNRLLISEESMESDSQYFENWLDNTDEDAPAQYFVYTFFNITNPTSVLQGEYPILEEVGPFAYRRYSTKLQVDNHTISFNDDGSVISYTQWDRYEYAPEESTSLYHPSEAKITTINVPLFQMFTFPDIFDEIPDPPDVTPYSCLASWTTRFCVDMFMAIQLNDEAELFYNANAHDLIWGYDDPITALIFEFLAAEDLDEDQKQFRLRYNETDPSKSRYHFSEKTGATAHDKMRELVSFRDSTLSVGGGTVQECYNTDNTTICEPAYAEVTKIEGSYMPSQFPFNNRIGRGSQLNVWRQDWWRSVKYVYDSDVNLHGADLLRFKVDPNEFLSEQNYSANAIYYQNDFDGLINLTAIPPLSRTWVTKAYNLDAPYYVDTVNQAFHMGQPNRERDDTFIDLDPVSGTAFRLQTPQMINFPFYAIDMNMTSPGAMACGDDCTNKAAAILSNTAHAGNTMPFPFVMVNVKAQASNATVQEYLTNLKAQEFFGSDGVIYVGFVAGPVLVLLSAALYYLKLTPYCSHAMSDT